MFKKSIQPNYLKNLIYYLSDFKEISVSTANQLKEIKDYYEATYDSKSATDSTELMRINNLFEKFSYFSKYIDVAKDFYENISSGSADK